MRKCVTLAVCARSITAGLVIPFMVFSKKLDILPLRKFDLAIKNKRQYFFWYTVLFAVMAVLCFWPFYADGKSLIWVGSSIDWAGDGLLQDYTGLVYISRWIRAAVLEHKTIPLIDFTIGYGTDVLVSLGGGFFSPFNWIAALFPVTQLEAVYGALLLVRYYLVGVTFSCYCFYMGRDYLDTLSGAFIYTFCGYCLFAGVRHPGFLLPAIWLPILLICIEKLIRGEKNRWLLSLWIAYMAVISHYFCYMLLIVGVIYGICRGVAVKKTSQEFGKLFLKALFYGFLGLGMAAAVLLPVCYSLLSSTRVDLPVYYANSALFYPAEYYKKLLLDFASPLASGSGYWVFLSVGAPAAVAIVLFIFTRQKEQRWLKQVFLVLFLILCVPFAGSVMNGFNYVTNRWVWAVCFFAAYILVCWGSRLPAASPRLVGGLAVFLTLALVLLCAGAQKPKAEQILSLLSMLLFVLLILFFIACKSSAYGFRQVVLLFCLAGIFVSANYKYSTDHKNYVSEFLPAGKAMETVWSDAEVSVKALNDPSFYRVSNNSLGGTLNFGMAVGFNSIGHYWSYLDDAIYRYALSTEIPGMIMSFRIYGFDQRSALESLACVKYYAMQEGSQTIVPSGYERVGTVENPVSGKKDVIYQNAHALPIGYTYKETVSVQGYEKHNPIEKEQLMLQKLVLEDGEDLHDTEFLGKQVACQVSGTQNLRWDKEKGVIKIDKPKATLSLAYNVPEGDTIYVRIKGFNTDGSSHTEATYTAASNGLTKRFYSKNKQDTWPVLRENYTINFGTSDGKEQTVEITFPYKAEYKLKDIEIYAVPEYRYADYLEDLKEESLENVTVATNRVEGDITVSGPKYLCFGIPYSKGWTAYVDGKRVDTIRANIMYMAVQLEPGHHVVRLTYCTPGLKAGSVISIICIGILSRLVVLYDKRRK